MKIFWMVLGWLGSSFFTGETIYELSCNSAASMYAGFAVFFVGLFVIWNRERLIDEIRKLN